MMSEPAVRTGSGDVSAWRNAADESPPYGMPVLCAWKLKDGWYYRVAKYTGKRWLDVIPETDNEEYAVPNYWQTVVSPEPRDG